MDCFASSSTGIIKGVDFKGESFVNLNDFRQLKPAQDGVTTAAWADSERTKVLCAQLDRSLKLFDGDYKELFKVDGGEGKVAVVTSLDESSILSGIEDGSIKIHSVTGSELAGFSCGPHLQCLQQSPTKAQEIAVAGRENPLQTYDTANPSAPTFRAKNVKDSGLALRCPVWDTGLVYQNAGREIVTCTGYHQLRVYDPRAQRKPVVEVRFSDNPFTCLTTCNRERHVIAGTTDGRLGLFDLRSRRKGFLVHAFKGFAGSIADVTAHPSLPVVCTASPDRFVRVHHVDTKQMLHKIYVKTRINKVLMRNELSILQESDSEDSDSEQPAVHAVGDSTDKDDVWDEMQPASRKRSSDVSDDGAVVVKRRKEVILKRKNEENCDLEVKKRKVLKRKRKLVDC